MSGQQNLMPVLDPATAAALRDSIEKHGVVVPVVVDQDGRIIDGHHRSRIADDLGIPYMKRTQQVADEDEFRHLSVELNTIRRHMPIEERQRIVAELRAAGHSERAIANTVGVSKTQVRNDLQVVTGDHLPAEVTGQDGKRYPATKPTATTVRVESTGQTAIQEPTTDPDVSRMAVHFSSQTDEWATPQAFFDVVAREFAFTLDVCALDSSAKCARYFTPDLDGLAHDWKGICWMNPPYGDVIGDWVRKADEAAAAGAIVVALLPARVDTGWWWNHVRHHEIRFLRGRLKFGGSPNSAPFPSALVVFGRPATVVWWTPDYTEESFDVAA